MTISKNSAVGAAFSTQSWSVEATEAQVVGNDDVSDCIKDKLDVVGVRGTGDVSVHFLVEGLVLAFILRLDVLHPLCECVRACILREADS